MFHGIGSSVAIQSSGLGSLTSEVQTQLLTVAPRLHKHTAQKTKPQENGESNTQQKETPKETRTVTKGKEERRERGKRIKTRIKKSPNFFNRPVWFFATHCMGSLYIFYIGLFQVYDLEIFSSML